MTDSQHQDSEEGEDSPPSLMAGTEDAWLAENIRDARKRLEMSQGELARRMADLGWPWHQQTVRRNEDGTRKISAGELAALARIFRTSPGRLMMPGREASAAALLETVTARVLGAHEQIAEWTVSHLAGHRQLERTAGEAETAGFHGSETVRRLALEAREVLALTPEDAVKRGREDHAEMLREVTGDGRN